MLLSFFIVLNSMSTFEKTKAESVIKSLNQSFWNDAPADIDKVSQSITSESESFRSGDALDNVKALFESTIPDAKATKNRLGSTLTVQVGKAEFEKALVGEAAKPEGVEPSPTEFKERFAAMLAALLDTQVSIPYTMDILLNVEQGPALLRKDNPAALDGHIKSVTGYVQLLQAQGLDAKLITPGLSQGEDETVTLVFKRYAPIALEVKNGQ